MNAPPQFNDIISEFDPGRVRIMDKMAHHYESGSSTDEISRQFGIPKTSVRQGLQRCGVRLRSVQETKGHSRPPYRFVYIDGNLVKHPVEQKRIEIIMRLAGAGHKAWRIQEELKKFKIPPRTGKAWCHKTIQKVIERSKNSFSKTS